ncbi:MAG TPA: isoprenylcysteine carboxylmethyltransferase family protein [Verrucomicrobiae bacterium]|nr:isoprenylcysteine carboxylmethyltransferase family protein [Verrucomicrobiae bacterium]
MAETAHTIILVCWVIFVSVWVASAARTKPILEKQSVASRMAHRLPLAAGWWLLIAPKWPRPLNWQIIPHSEFLDMISAAVCICGLVFTIWARQTLAGNWSADVTFKKDHELIRRGPYHIVRHPIYTGLLAMFLGTAILIGQVRGAVSLVLITIGFWIKLRQEERLMVQHFPEAYPGYRREVKALVPFVI